MGGVVVKKPEIGQTLYSLNVGNSARNREQTLTPYVVVKVGRKYFTIRRADDELGRTDTQFHLDSWAQKTEYVSGHSLFLSERDYYQGKEASQLFSEIGEYFKHRSNKDNIPLEALQGIKRIMDANRNPGNT